MGEKERSEEREVVYILFESINGKDYIQGVYKTRKAAWAEKKKLRAAQPDRTITYPIMTYKVEE